MRMSVLLIAVALGLSLGTGCICPFLQYGWQAHSEPGPGQASATPAPAQPATTPVPKAPVAAR